MSECTHNMPQLVGDTCPYCEMDSILRDLHGLLEIKMWSESGKEWQRQVAEIYDRYSDKDIGTKLLFDGEDIPHVTLLEGAPEQAVGSIGNAFDFDLAEGWPLPKVGDIFQVNVDPSDDRAGRYVVRKVDDRRVYCEQVECQE